MVECMDNNTHSYVYNTVCLYIYIYIYIYIIYIYIYIYIYMSWYMLGAAISDSMEVS